MSEPSGMMDFAGHTVAVSPRSHSNQIRNQIKPGNAEQLNEQFTIHDLADEEVHFSRSSSEQYYFYNSTTATARDENLESRLPESPRPSRNQSYVALQRTASVESNNRFVNVNLVNQTGGQSRPSIAHLTSVDIATACNQDEISTDQIKSSRLLHTIGSKLRRGSNYYLIAPKLVSQYLLGITIQNWSEFLNTSRMLKAPGSRHQLTRRVITNLNHFQGNYLCVSLILIVYCILTSPLLLLAIACYLLSLYAVTARSALGKQSKVFGYRLNLQQQYSFITMISLPLLWVAGAPSAVFWVIGASFFVVGVHASMYANECEAALKLVSNGAVGGGRGGGGSSGAYLNISNLAQDNANSSGGHAMSSIICDNLQLNNSGQASNRSHLISSAIAPPTSSARYYNHYPTAVPSTSIYSALPLESPTSGGSCKHDKSSASSSSNGNYLTQWIGFSSGRNPSRSGNQTDVAGGHKQKTPGVKIISQDYAGLGRVYEV